MESNVAFGDVSAGKRRRPAPSMSSKGCMKKIMAVALAAKSGLLRAAETGVQGAALLRRNEQGETLIEKRGTRRQSDADVANRPGWQGCRAARGWNASRLVCSSASDRAQRKGHHGSAL